jgi:hypothetical protein
LIETTVAAHPIHLLSSVTPRPGPHGYASSFDQARAAFEAVWKNYLPQYAEADFIEYRRQGAWTAWKYAMHDAGLPLPTQLASGHARCFCGAAIDIAVTDLHVQKAHMMDSQHA